MANLKELILYVALRCEKDERFGRTKLNKLLYFADFEAYRRFRRSISGCPYMKLQEGPVPKPMKRVLKHLASTGEIEEETRDYYGRQQIRPIAKREPDLSRFDHEHISLLDEIINKCWPQSAKEVSEESHDRRWIITRDFEDIPYEYVFLRTEDAPSEAALKAFAAVLESSN